MLLKEDRKVSGAVSNLLLEHYGITGEIHPLQGEVDLNFYVIADSGECYTLKISDEADFESIQFQNAMLSHVKECTMLKLPYVVRSLSGNEMETIIFDRETRLIRLLTWVPGRLFAYVKPHSAKLLTSLGIASAELSQALSGFDHEGAHRAYKWDPAQAFWVKEHLEQFPTEKEAGTIRYFYDLFEENQPLLRSLRKSVTHNDINDYNILVSEHLEKAVVEGIIDFGDAIYTYTVNELAITLAYAMMDKEDPVYAACHVISGFHSWRALTETEVEALLTLIGARLIISVTASMLNKKENPDNEYLSISEKPAWKLLYKLQNIPKSFIHYSFRSACGWNARPGKSLSPDKVSFAPVIKGLEENIYNIDLSVGSKKLGNAYNYASKERVDLRIKRILEDADHTIGYGRYGEVRPFYNSSEYQKRTDDGFLPKARALGVDFFSFESRGVMAAYDGVVHSVLRSGNEATIILSHKVEGIPFFTLYKHLSTSSIKDVVKGKAIKQGVLIAKIGSEGVHGVRLHHLHFQIIYDLLGYEMNFPATASSDEWNVWSQICPDPSPFFKWKSGATINTGKQKIIEKRDKYLGKALSVSYNDPLHIIRGYKQHLFDITGRPYLDMVNNVAHVGHEHPAVVEAGQRQIAVLNTNTRYLHEEITLFAEELLATLPSHLKVCHFVNSGSEANELALRMVQACTGSRHMIVLESGYHGNTGGCIDISSYKFDGKGGKGAPEHTHVIPAPDYFRGIYQGQSGQFQKYIAHVKDALVTITSKGGRVGGFIAESILSCAGQIVLPTGYLAEIYKLIHREGGVCIADEVQVGVGRVGEKFWGFELQGVQPDIVTIGKPLGNGHPLAAVVCTQEVADQFNNGMEYFNTFGGNPVSCSIGRAVLRVVREEKLQQNALQMGNLLLDELKALQKQYPIIGDVRGHGLFSGFELVRGLTPATKEATYLANRMKEKGILMSTDGPDNNVLKLKPPICISQQDIAFFMKQLEDVFKEDFLKA
ncbi:aminotransferase class III-fold pyridoxal phosphate-dependent enzyme [Fulvivirga ulvae]|uniref:aminotransferase class III-fold pyridoxal phosphate-dependent enzyme n=1 Tax=Fulvivirga ulvae TaxID=2904245 RepID=UPI001F3DD097|nr:aminotransferase class III-fold pyridoxal phosphate-dependent enzyme [Fulvivirga ulvae]UII34646.1 aminotransferase class III-fold pyridoxal phosphate-dependent enzyme [Fulvivirga ulvae]